MIILILYLFSFNMYAQENKHSPKKAVLYSLVPGGGQWYNQKRVKSLSIFGIHLGIGAGWYLSSDLNKKSDYGWGFALAMFINIIDAYVDAHLFDFDKQLKEGGNFSKDNIKNNFNNN